MPRQTRLGPTTERQIVAFMQPQVYKGGYFKVNTSVGTEIVPADLVGATGGTVAVESLRYYLEGEPDDANEVEGMETGWLARMSAPGYLDCTAWSAYPTEAAAWAALHEMFEA